MEHQYHPRLPGFRPGVPGLQPPATRTAGDSPNSAHGTHPSPVVRVSIAAADARKTVRWRGSHRLPAICHLPFAGDSEETVRRASQEPSLHGDELRRGGRRAVARRLVKNPRSTETSSEGAGRQRLPAAGDSRKTAREARGGDPARTAEVPPNHNILWSRGWRPQFLPGIGRKLCSRGSHLLPAIYLPFAGDQRKTVRNALLQNAALPGIGERPPRLMQGMRGKSQEVPARWGAFPIDRRFAAAVKRLITRNVMTTLGCDTEG